MQQIKVPPPENVRPPRWYVDSLAKSEDKNWTDEDSLRGQRNTNNLRFLRVYGWIVVVLMVFFSVLFGTSLLIWSLHYLTPIGWLTDDQLSKIQSVIFSGTLGAVIANVFRNQISGRGWLGSQ